MTTTDPRAWLAELTDHLTDMADSLDDHVTHEDVHRLLMEARQLSLQRDAALTAVLRLVDRAESSASSSMARMFGGDPFPATVSTESIRTAITDALGGDRR